MNVLIVDDEPLARRVLLTFLRDEPDVARVVEASTGAEAARCLGSNGIDLVFLDVHLPDLDGFQVLESVEPHARPVVVLVSAFERHALRAFRFDVADYLLKPFDDRRFAESLARARERLRGRALLHKSGELAELLLKSFAATPSPSTSASARITLDDGARLDVIATADILWVEAQDKYVVVHTTQRTYRTRRTIAEVEQLLDPQMFLRVHRSCIVSLPKVVSIERTAGGATYAVLVDGARVVVSRSRASLFRTQLQRQQRRADS